MESDYDKDRANFDFWLERGPKHMVKDMIEKLEAGLK